MLLLDLQIAKKYKDKQTWLIMVCAMVYPFMESFNINEGISLADSFTLID